jgi:uncharacterized protein YmfQ (DUF2313 family)
MSEGATYTGLPPDVVALCGIPVEELRDNLLDLLPVGPVWPRMPETTLARFWLAIADSMLALRKRDCDLLAESYPCGAVELLEDWERVLGLPDECTVDGDWPLAVRQGFVCAKLAAQGGQSIAYFVALAASYGFTIKIVEHAPWRMGCTDICDAHVGVPPSWWTVICVNLPVLHAGVGCWFLGEPICVVEGADVLECIIRRAAPAGSTVTFSFPKTLPKAVWDTGIWNFDAWEV